MRFSLWNPLSTSLFSKIRSNLFFILVSWCIISGDNSRNFFSTRGSLITIASASDVTRNSLGSSFDDIETRETRVNLGGVCYAEAYLDKCHYACARVPISSTISSSNSSYTAGGPPIKVKITNNEDIDGMIVYAVRYRNVKVGSWTWIKQRNDMMYDECSTRDLGKNQTLISRRKVTRNIEIVWFPPNIPQGNIIFRVLLVRLSSPRAGYEILEKRINVSVPSPTSTTISTSTSESTSTTAESTYSSVSYKNDGTPPSQPTGESCDYIYGAPTPQPLSCSAAIGRIDGKTSGMVCIWMLASLISFIR